MKVLITGGAGFVGSRFHEMLTDLGHETVRFDLLPPDDKSEFVKGDVRDLEALTAAMQGCDAVLHLAAAHHDFGIATQTFHDVNVMGMENVCAAMLTNSIKRLCFYSTVAVYGEQKPPVDESTTPAPISDYGKTKLLAEAVCEKWSQQGNGNRCLVMRPTVIFGPNHFANMYTLVRQIESGKFVCVGKMENIKSLAYIDNIVNATIELWLNDAGDASGYQCLNYIDKPDLSSRQIVNEIYKGLEKNPPKIFIPYPIAQLLALPFDLIIKLTGKNLPISSARIRKLAVSNTQVEADKVHQATKLKGIPLKDGIRNMVQWYVSKGKQLKQSNRRPHATESK